MSFEKLMTADRRLLLLRVLNEMISYKANSSVLTIAMEHYGHAVSRDYVKTQLAWLQEQDLVTVEEVGPLVVATLTQRGQEAARGLVIVPGVSRPGA